MDVGSLCEGPPGQIRTASTPLIAADCVRVRFSHVECDLTALDEGSWFNSQMVVWWLL